MSHSGFLSFVCLLWASARVTCVFGASVTHQGKRFGTTIYNNPHIVSQRELFLATRSSFQSADYLQDILDGAQRNSKLGKVRGVRLTYCTTAMSVVLSFFVLPGLDVHTSVKNGLGLLALGAPFGSLLVQQYGPEILQKDYSSEKTERERICYHEAGHLLVGYLAGLASDGYVIDGDGDSGLSIDTRNVVLGNVLMCAMAGSVAESLRFGDNTGGAADVTIALEALRSSNMKNKDEINGHLRFGLLKSLTLLRLYRDVLDEIALKMSEDASIYELVRIIEAYELD